MTTTYIEGLRRQLRELTSGDPWIGESLHGKLDSITEQEAYTEPAPGLHSVAQLVSHLHEWRQSVLSILQGNGRTLTMSSPHNWMANNILKRVGWDALKRVAFESQEKILAELEGKDDAYLQRRDAEGRTFGYYVEGLIHHDCYHLGQMGLAVRMLRLK